MVIQLVFVGPPVDKHEVDRLHELYRIAEKHPGTFEEHLQPALTAILVSPHFLFRVEQEKRSTEAYPISDFELASRAHDPKDVGGGCK